MGMPSAQVQAGTQPQGKGFAQPINPPNNPSQMMGMSSKIGRLPPMMSDQLDAPAVMQDQQNIASNLMGGPMRTKDMPMMQKDALLRPAVTPLMSQVMPFDQQQVTPPAQQQSRGKGGSTSYSPTSGQPSFGQPNRYPNTVGQWDNASIQRQPSSGGGKGKG